MKRTALAAILAISAGSVLANPVPSFVDTTDISTTGSAQVSLGNVNLIPAPSFVDFAEHYSPVQGLAGRSASEARGMEVEAVAQPIWTPAY